MRNVEVNKETVMKRVMKIVPLGVVLAVLLLVSGCGSGGPATVPGSSSSTTTTTSTNGSIALSISSGLPATAANSTNTVTFGTAVYASAIVTGGNGVPIPNVVVTFTAASGIVVFTPILATALTAANGIASVSMDAASISTTGATSITASVSITSGSTTTTLTSTPVGIAVNGATVTLGALTLGNPFISSYGSSVVSVPVFINGVAATTPISVAFTSPCVTSAKATLTSPVTTVAGTATSTYTDNNCASGIDAITASVTGASVNTTITVAIPAANNMQFVSATPAIIGTFGTGAATLPQNSLVKFKVVDNNSNGRAGVLVDFSLLPNSAPGGIKLTPTSATSDANGQVTTTITSGTVPTPVWVVAKVHDNPTILSQSNTLTITTGLPTQNFFSLSVQTFNVEGWEYDGVTSTLTVIASDRLGNPVPDGTAINFITEGCQIQPASCTTTSGTCSVTFRTSEYRPRNETTATNPNGAVAALDENGHAITDSLGAQLFAKNGRVTVLAYAVGEKSFVDSNGNNVYDVGETFYDIGDLFLDSNENGTWDHNPTQPNLVEQYISYAPVAAPVACLTHIGGGGTIALPINYSNVKSKDGSCSGVWGNIYVRRDAVITLSSSSSIISQTTFTMGGSCRNTFSFWLMDVNNNPMPAGTTVSTTNNYVTFTPTGATTPTTATLTITGTPVLNSSHAGGTRIALTVDGGSTCTGTGPVPFPVGTVNIVTTTPKGVSTYNSITVN